MRGFSQPLDYLLRVSGYPYRVLIAALVEHAMICFRVATVAGVVISSGRVPGAVSCADFHLCFPVIGANNALSQP
jgi:hypothetical protein